MVTDMGMQEKLSGQTSRNDDHGQYPDQRQQQTEQAPEDVSARDSAEQEKSPPNGGVNSWLNVAAAFCVFVNTWYALANNVEVQHSRIGFINLFMAIIACLILCRHPRKKTRARSLVEWKALKQPTFMLLSVSLTCVMLAYYVPIFYVATYARVKLNTETNLSFYLVSIINGASAFGRTVPYLLGSRVNTAFVLISCTTASAIAMYTWIATSNTAGFIVWACYWGFLSGVLVTAPTAIVAHPVFTPDKNYLGTRMGMMWGISSFGSLAGAPIAGALVDLEHKNFVRSQVFAGSLMVGAVLLQLWPTIVAFRYDRNKDREAKH
ncbi:hypothetical protein APSETT445_009134 [Aspergillus pseudonomiae]